MEVVDLDGNKSRIKISHRAKCKKPSSYHLRAREVLNEEFKSFIILEEVPVQIRKGETFYLDFFIPLLRRAYEVDGQQHTKFNLHFHKDRHGWLREQKRDRDKQTWCELNDIELVRLNYNEENSEWIAKIRNST